MQVVDWKTGASFKGEAKLGGTKKRKWDTKGGGITTVVTSGDAGAAGPSCHDGAPNLQPLTPPGQGCVKVVEGHAPKEGGREGVTSARGPSVLGSLTGAAQVR